MAISTITHGSVRCLGLAMLLVAALLVSSGSNQVMAQNCKDKSVLGNLVSQCSNYVMKTGSKVKPLASCCKAVKAVDVRCVCNFVTKDIERIVDMEKVVYVARSCGKKIKSGTKCGSYTVHQNKN
ncbi:hypothetical protein FEM48_ZijujUnG0023400 [Ziziphus jujuba var. spinosa]|uniref:Bifunctional inhibitor/plant lipid transfer protein/seed storage helical domain-containing protein n=1 Tax=Ziziphus jujuba var. spinosa TaxID=714518 RepID=A0A978U9P6_ZIZJJ|nr:uncharacterized protein LOC107410817 [Ziziphus jujuba var. spinosa]KAH7511326.1 hypothetical protein FEM48_ZijujUnG0023400 [Ziziphus jujuba var. spinosa]